MAFDETETAFFKIGKDDKLARLGHQLLRAVSVLIARCMRGPPKVYVLLHELRYAFSMAHKALATIC